MEELKKLIEAGVKTPKGKSYWASDSPYSGLLGRLFEELVPAQGNAETLHGELIRSFGRLNYEFGNNGNCNAIDTLTETCDTCGGSGFQEEEDCYSCNGSMKETNTEDEEVDCSVCNGSGVDELVDCNNCCGECSVYSGVIINDGFEVYIDFIERNIPNEDGEVVQAFRAFLLNDKKGYSNYTFDNSEMGIYNALGDAVMKAVATTENKDLEVSSKQD